MKIDAQVFFWKDQKPFSQPLIRANKILQQPYLPEQVQQSLHRNGIEGCLAAAAEPLDVEGRFLAELSSTHPDILGVIAWPDLSGKRSPDVLEEFNTYTAVRGYRMEYKNGLPENSVMEKLAEQNRTLDLLFDYRSINSSFAGQLAKWPDQHFILSDSGRPHAGSVPDPQWRDQIRALAENQNLSCKVSGIFSSVNPKTWKPADLFPFFEILFDSFGIERMLYASDWPFLLVSGMYVQWKSLLEKFTEHYSEDEKDLFFGENAARIYGI